MVIKEALGICIMLVVEPSRKPLKHLLMLGFCDLTSHLFFFLVKVLLKIRRAFYRIYLLLLDLTEVQSPEVLWLRLRKAKSVPTAFSDSNALNLRLV